MNAIATTPMRPAPAPLSDATSLNQQIIWLDALRHDADRYVRLLRNLLTEMGTHCLIQYDQSGRSLFVGAYDDDFAARYARARALLDHVDQSGMRIDLMAAIEADGWVSEMRCDDVRALTLTIKRFLNMGGILFLTPEGDLRENSTSPAEWVQRGPNALEIESTARAWLTIRRLPGMEARAARFVRMAGVPHGGGLVVLEKRS